MCTRPRALAAALLLALGCAGGAARPDAASGDAGEGRADAGEPADAGLADGGPQCVGGAPSAPCCDASGQRTGEGICVGGAWTCGAWALCRCAGQALTWQCADLCGSDAWASPACAAGGWECPAGTIRTDACPAGLCWSEGPRCCSDGGTDYPTCIDGHWRCSAGFSACP